MINRQSDFFHNVFRGVSLFNRNAFTAGLRRKCAPFGKRNRLCARARVKSIAAEKAARFPGRLSVAYAISFDWIVNRD
jgi:hypothetical protein